MRAAFWFWLIFLLSTFVSLICFNLLFYKKLWTGCRSWNCTYKEREFQPLGNCVVYHIKAENYTVDCYSCLHYVPVNNSLCYDNGLDPEHGGYCAAYLSCRNENNLSILIAVNATIGVAMLAALIGLIVQWKTGDPDYITLS